MQKSKLFTSFMVISVVLLLIFPFVPHHHHSGVACVAMDIPENLSTPHSTDHCTSELDFLCLEDITYFGPKKNDQHSFFAQQDLLTSLISSVYLLFSTELNLIPLQVKEFSYINPPMGCYNADIDLVFTVRGPPLFLI